jgi:trigger factor
MQVTVESTSILERRMKIVVPSEKIDEEVSQRMKKAASTVKMKGFRPGKVPMREIKRRFGPGLHQEVSGEMMQSSFLEAVDQENLKPAGMPKIEEVSSESGENLEFTAIFEVYPEIELTGYSEIDVEKLLAKVTDEDVENMIDVLRKQQTSWEEVKRKSKLGDRLNLDFEGSVDGEPFEGGKAEGVDIELGSGSMIPGFEDGLKGIKAEEEKSLQLTFPEDYHVKDLAGNEAKFDVKANSVSKPVLPELNEDFYRRYGVAEGGHDEFKDEVRGNMEKELEQATNNRVKTQVMDGLLATNQVEMPQSLVDGEIDKLRQEAIQQFGGQNAGNIDASLLPSEMFQKQAERRVALGLLVGEVLKQEDLEADGERVRAMIENMASSYEDSDQVVKWYYSNEEQLNQVRNLVLEEQVVERILEDARVTEVESNYEEAIKPPAREEDAASVEEAVADEDDEDGDSK